MPKTLLVLAALAFVTTAARAETMLDKIYAQGFVRCASVPRPGLADDGKGEWRGLEIELCRAIAVAALGANARFAYHALRTDTDFDSVRAGDEEVVFLTFSEMQEQGLTDKLLPGPTVFFQTHSIMVADASPVKRPEDLAGRTVCSLAGSASDRSLDAFASAHEFALQHRPFSEEGEMFDAFRVQSCQAVVGEATSLAQERLDGGINHLAMRILPQPLHVMPLVAATPLTADSRWAAIVAWTMQTLVAAARPETNARAGGLRAMSVAPAGLGLSQNWQKTVVETVGDYDTIYRRTLGTETPLKLEPGLNASSASHGALVAPTAD